MKCPKCESENPEDSKFCRKCGSSMESVISCPSCGTTHPQDSNFCNKCGHNLTIPSEPTPKDLSFDEKLDKTQRYLPKGLTNKILSQRDKIEGERKHVTVMFCDMEGFTSMVERLGPEEAYGIMDQVYEILIHKVHDYEGTVNEMTGDGIMALFGAPIALEDAPQRAIRSAYSIHREMAKFIDKINQGNEEIMPLKMRIGIHTGPVVVGTLGNDLRVEFKAVGDTVNLASRMEGLAEPGATYVTGEIFKLTEGLFRFEALGEKRVKGKEEAVPVYRVIAPSSRKTRFDVSAERGLTPFVGRERELELLLDGFERAKDGHGQAFSIMAEAGVGKSRLLYEFRKTVGNEDVTFLEGKCLSYSRSVAYHPIIDVLKSNFDIQEGDDNSRIKEKVKRGLKLLGTDEVSTRPYLLELLSVKGSGLEKISLSPEAKKSGIMEALKRIVIKGSEIRPLIMAIEDLHWSDKSSEDSLKELLESITGARVFLVFTYRPEFVLTWGGRSYHSQVNLNRLSNRESLVVIRHLFGTEDIHKDLEELILEKTEGVPFFVEEFIKSLKGLNIVENRAGKYHLTKNIKDVTIPSTIQDVIMARVDSLREGAKEVVQTGSVIERDFSYDLIKRVMGLPEQELLSHLSALKDSELVYERGVYPQSNFIFKHALTREVVYDSILNKKRKELHGKIASSIEELFSENIHEHYNILANHFIENENYEKGAEYSRLAGDKAIKSCAHPDAIEYAKKRVQCIERFPITESTQRSRIDARRTLAAYYQNLARFIDAYEAVAPIVDLAEKFNDQKSLPAIYTTIGLYNLYVEEDHSKGCQYLTKVLDFPVNPRNYFSLWMANHNLAWYFSWNCEFERGLTHFEKCLDLATPANDLVGMSWSKGTIAAFVYCFQGKLDYAHPITEESIGLSEKSGDIHAKVAPRVSHGLFCHLKGRFEEAESSLIQGMTICEKAAVVAMWALSSGLLGDFYSDFGKYEKVRHYYKTGIDILQNTTFWPTWINMWEISMERLKVLDSNHNIDLDLLFRNYENNNLKFCDGRNARNIADILLNIGGSHMSLAENWIKKAIEEDKRNGLLWQLASDYAVYSELFKRKGEKSVAKESLSKAITIFKECGADGWVEKYEKELTALS